MNKKPLIVFILSFALLFLAGALFCPQKTEAVSGTETLEPNAPGDLGECQISSQFGCPVCPNHHGCVLVSNGDTTYIHTNAIPWQRDLYNFTNSAINGGTINAVTVYAVARGVTSINQASLKLAIKTGGTVSEGSEQTLTTNYATYSNTWAVNPSTGAAWTWDDINNIQAGVSIRRCFNMFFMDHPTRVTQVYVGIDYDIEMCKKPDEWNDQGECFIEIVYQDPMPGSGLESCYYRIRNRINGGYDDSPAWQDVSCHGEESVTYNALMEIGPAGTCSALGEAACMLEAMAVDIAGNSTVASQLYNVTAHDLTVNSSPIENIFITGNPAAYSDVTNYQISDILPGTDIELEAPETHIDAGILYYFDNWDGCDSVSGPDNRICQLNMNSNATVTAEYLFGPYPPDNLQESWDPCAWGSFLSQQAAPGLTLILSWDYDHPQGHPQAAYEIWIEDSAGNFATTTKLSSATSYVLELNDFGTWKNTQCDHSPEYSAYSFGYGLCWNSHYYWRVKVQDDQGYWSGWSAPIKETDQRTPVHAWPYPDFSWQPDPIMVGEVIQFTDESEAFGGATTTWWWWQFQNGNPATSNDQNPTTTFSVATTTRVDLEVFDNTLPAFGGPYHCSTYEEFDVALPLPDYREVAPIGRLDNFLARIAGIFR